MGQWTRVENSNKVFLRVTNHTGQAEKNLLGPAGTTYFYQLEDYDKEACYSNT